MCSTTYQFRTNALPVYEIPRLGHPRRRVDDVHGRVSCQHLVGVEDLGGAVVVADEVLELPDYVGLPAFVAWGSEAAHFFLVSLGVFGEGGVVEVYLGLRTVG